MMTPRQRTFELIPETLFKSAGPRRPMTSKEAKKAYLEARRGPRISREEQRRLDAEEIERQKKEYERERAAVKAKAAREKKVAKAAADKVARKKLGIPEPSKFVRASQPTISMFVKNGNKRTWQEMDNLADDLDDPLVEVRAQREDEVQPKAKGLAGDDSEDEFGDFPALSQSDLPKLLEDLNGSDGLLKENKICPEINSPAPQHPSLETAQLNAQSKDDAAQVVRKEKSIEDEEFPFDDLEMLAEMANTQLRSEAADAAMRTEVMQQDSSHTSPALQQTRSPSNSTPRTVNHKKRQAEMDQKTNCDTSRPALQERSTNIAPLAPPPKPSKTISFAPTPTKPRLSTRLTITDTPSKMLPALPPSATQAFLHSYFDDFYPSPTQEVRELHSDDDPLSAPSNSVKNTIELPNRLPTATVTATNKAVDVVDVVNMGPFSTQDFILSSQDLLEILAPNRVPPKQAPQLSQSHSRSHPVERVSQVKPRFFEEKEEDLYLAALHESSVMAAQIEPPQPSSRRSLQRTLSTATDYGDEEFREFEQELLALG